MLEDFKEPAPEGAELEAFLSAPKHHLARLIRDLFSEEASATSMEVPQCGISASSLMFCNFCIVAASLWL
jgi:hypothetical protein